jgi:hypothetical protein
LKFLNSQYLIQTQLTEKKFVIERKKIEELLKFYSDLNSTSSSIGKGERIKKVLFYNRIIKKIT